MDNQNLGLAEATAIATVDNRSKINALRDAFVANKRKIGRSVLFATIASGAALGLGIWCYNEIKVLKKEINKKEE